MPYFLAISPGGQPGVKPLQEYAGLTGTSFTWSTNVSAGTSFQLSLTDSTGQTVQSAPVTIQAGPDSSCLNAGSVYGQTPTSSGSVTSPSIVTSSITDTTTVTASIDISRQTSHYSSTVQPSQSSHSSLASSITSTRVTSTRVDSGENTPGTSTVSSQPTTVSPLPITQSKGLPSSATGGIGVGATLLVVLLAVLSWRFNSLRDFSLCRRRLRKRSGSWMTHSFMS